MLEPVPGSVGRFTTATQSTASHTAAPISGGLKHRGEEIALGTSTETLGTATWFDIKSKISCWKGIFPAKRPGSPWPVAPAGTRTPCVCCWDLEDFFSTAT